MVLLELIGLLVIVSKYFAVMLMAFCIIVRIINNILYLVILGGVLLVVFIVTMLIGSLTNLLIPFVVVQISYVGGLLFLVMIMLLLIM